MKFPFWSLPLVTALIWACLVQNSNADQNAAPVNVGLYNYSTITVTASPTPTPMLPRNLYRAGLIIQNNGSTSVVVKPGSPPANATDGVILTAGQFWEPIHTPVDALYGESASSSDKIIMIENAK